MLTPAKIGSKAMARTSSSKLKEKGVIMDIYNGFCDGKVRYKIAFRNGVEIMRRKEFKVMSASSSKEISEVKPLVSHEEPLLQETGGH